MHTFIISYKKRGIQILLSRKKFGYFDRGIFEKNPSLSLAQIFFFTPRKLFAWGPHYYFGYLDREIVFAISHCLARKLSMSTEGFLKKIPHCHLLNFLAYPIKTSFMGTPTPTKIILWGKSPRKSLFCGGEREALRKRDFLRRAKTGGAPQKRLFAEKRGCSPS